jgi:hypothetical protein
MEGEARRYFESMPERLLIAAGESASGPGALPGGIRELITAADEILVVSPNLPSRLEWLASATDRSEERADERLGVVLDHLGEMGAAATGEVGADDPLVALEDAISEFKPDHLLIAVRRGEQSDWQERHLLDAVYGRFGLPLTVFSPA